MSASGTRYPLTASDLPCEVCGLYFTLDFELTAHREAVHPGSLLAALITCGHCGAWCNPGVVHVAWGSPPEPCIWPAPLSASATPDSAE